MKISRVTTAALTFAAISLLAACGGGGGGGGGTLPGGGNGGGGATPTPTIAPTQSPTQSPTSTPTPSNSLTIKAEENFINGDPSWYTSGTNAWASSSGDPSNAPGSGANVDGTTCNTGYENQLAGQNIFWQHVFVGIYNNGVEEALPQGLGVIGAVAPTQGTPSHTHNTDEIEQYTCAFNLHTHDYSGLIHIMDQTLTESNQFPSYATLQTFLDTAGATLSATGFQIGGSSLTGATTVYVGTPSSKNSAGEDLVTNYAPYAGSYSALQFTKHMAIWIVVGTPPTAGLPTVDFVVVN